jgi:hypothetical protein
MPAFCIVHNSTAFRMHRRADVEWVDQLLGWQREPGR